MSDAGTERAFLAIADVSGYTNYLAGVELDHSQDILSDLTVTVVEAMAPFQLLKLEGDAARLQQGQMTVVSGSIPIWIWLAALSVGGGRLVDG